jgi:sialate O-acetylesterase
MDFQAQEKLEFNTTQDSYVSKSSSSSNYGTEDKLLIKGSTGGNFNRKSYLKFDITGSDTTYEQILIKLVKSDGEELKVSTHSSSTNWNESNINWSNAPEPISEVGQGNLRTADTLFVDVTNYIKSKINNNQLTLSFILSSDEIIGSPFKVFSKENSIANNRPKLIFHKTKKINFIEEISLSKYISSDMIIQRGQPFPFRGEGPVGEMIHIDFVREGVTKNASGVIDANGEFNVSIPAMEATSTACTATISITGYPERTVVLNNILIGDVWFAGGQSNMEKKVDYLLDAETVIADADNYTNIRAFRAEYNSVFDPTDQVKSNNASWVICDTQNVDKVSAVAYIFAKKVFQETGIPIGLMQAYVGGTEIETWLSEDKIENDNKLQFIEDRLPSYDENDSRFYQNYPSVNYNGMINPLRFFPIKGFLFYQGESNVKRAPEYAVLMKSLIQDYRAKWNLGELPFYFVQLFNIGITSERNYEEKSNDETWQMLRQQQYLVAEKSGLKNIGMAVTIETNEERTNSDANIRIHPRNKKPVGERLAKIALKEQYAKAIIAYSPLVDSTWVVNNKVFIRMKNVGDGLKVRNNETNLVGFAIGNSSGTYYNAAATIEESNLLSVQNSQVANPAFIAYGWSRDPLCTLDNSENLPASPFKIELDAKKTYGAVEDAFIKKGSEGDTNFGASLELDVAKGSDETEGEKITFLKFDISNFLFTAIDNAKLRLYANTTENVTNITAHSAENSWSENEITWNNAPIIGAEISRVSVDNATVFYDWDITTSLKSAIENEDFFLSIALKNNSNSLVNFASKETNANRPMLFLNDESTLSTELILVDNLKFVVYPNPVKQDFIKIYFQDVLKNSLPKISMINLLGQEFIMPSSIIENEYQINISKLSSGTYFLIVQSNKRKFHKKVIIL